MHEVLKRIQSIFLRRLDDTVDRCTGLRASWRVSKQPVFSPNDKRLDRPLSIKGSRKWTFCLVPFDRSMLQHPRIEI
jgi:hypothetical protein